MRFALKCITVCLVTGLFVGKLPADEGLRRPKNHLGYSDAAGRMLLWRDVTSVPLEGGKALPLRVRFCSAPAAGTPLFGKFWSCPLLESSLISKNEKTLIWMTLAGRTVYLKEQKDGTCVSGDRNVVAKRVSPSEWMLTSDGWSYKYVSGKLRGVKMKSGEELEWVYQGTRLLGISSGKSGNLLSLEYTANGSFPSALIVGRERHSLEYQQVPICANLMGQPVIAGYETSLSKIVGPGEMHAFPIQLEQVGDYVMNFVSDHDDPRKFVWGAADGGIKSDGKWTYAVATKEKIGPVVSRTNKDGGTESYFYDSKTGTSEHKLPDGTLISRAYFIAAGPTQYKIRKATGSKNGKEISSRQWSYDEMGRLIRDKSGHFEFNWTWGPGGTLLAESEFFKETLVKETKYDEQGRPLLRNVEGKLYRYSYGSGKTTVQRIADGKVMHTKVIDPESGAVAFFKDKPESGILQGATSLLANVMSPEELEKARLIAQQSLQAFQNENTK